MKNQDPFIRKNEKLDIVFETDFPCLKFPLLEQAKIVEHCFTTRMGGVSTGIFDSLNLSFSRGDDEAAVRKNYQRIAKALSVEIGDFVCSDQTHTTNVKRVGKSDCGKGVIYSKDYTNVDGLITNEPNVVLATFYADCVPLYFVDPVHRAIGLSHSGWRGTVGRMGEKTLLAMKENFCTEPKDVIAAIGPSICKDCYEVSADVAMEFAAQFKEHEKDILCSNGKLDEKGQSKYQLDLWKANELVLLEAGILPMNLAVTNICTCCNSKLLFSHRASKGQRGNLGAFLYLKEAE